MAPSWSRDTVAVVTGANRGIGLEIVGQLAEQGLTVVLTARDRTKGQATANDLVAKGLKSVVFHELDVSDSESAKSLASWLKTEYGGLDILINNAAVSPRKHYSDSPKYVVDYESALYVLNINYYGVRKVTAGLLPLLKPSVEGSRIINITTRAGLYERLQSESIKNIFRDEEKYTEEVADSLAGSYLEDAKARKLDEATWVRPNGAKS